MRTINIGFTSDDWTYVCLATDPLKAEEALGYLATWNQTFRHVLIYTRQDEIVAAYKTDPADDKPSYVIGAVWRPDDNKFSFHS